MWFVMHNVSWLVRYMCVNVELLFGFVEAVFVAPRSEELDLN